MNDDRIMPVDGDKLIEIIDQMTVMSDQIKTAQVSLVRVTLLLYDLIDCPVPDKLAEVAALLQDVSHGT